MCGINGILRLDRAAPPVDRDELTRTRDRMASRGPDGSGMWCAPDGEIGLGHRRLAIIDLSAAGLQPMSWKERYWIVFNGEIYNYRELRASLDAEGVRFRSTSDTEVVLALYEREGASLLSRLRGMYAFAVWDSVERVLFLARDPYGIKPLYFSGAGGYFRFASQVRALEAGGSIPGDPDPAGLAGFLLWGSVPEPHTLRRAVKALPAGHSMVVREGRVGAPTPFHRLGVATLDGGDDLASSLADSVKAHLVADVPIAVFLSSGLDSALIAALARRESAEALTTLTITFDEFAGTEDDEGPLASEIARVLGTRHLERRVRPESAGDLWTSCLEAMDQPSIDGFNTYVVSRVAHEAGFKVVLSGLGGDELMGSYPSFAAVPSWTRLASRFGRLPGAMGLCRSLPVWSALGRPKMAAFLELGRSLPGAYFLRRGLFLPRELPNLIGSPLAAAGLEAYDPVEDAARSLDDAGIGRRDPSRGWEAVHLMESSMYMRNQLLRDSDWASMAHSLELRVPLVDARLQRAAASCGFRPAKAMGKKEVVRAAASELPAAVFDRPKSGFSVPIAKWLMPPGSAPATRGQGSRYLALRVLEGFGIDVARGRSPSG